MIPTNLIKIYLPNKIADLTLRIICKKHNLYLIADCAQSAGTKYKGERKNTLGDVSCFSFFPTKNLGCDGDGGVITSSPKPIPRALKASIKASVPFPQEIPYLAQGK